MKTIVVSSFHGLISRNILEAGVLQGLVEHTRVVLIVPEKKKQFFEQSFGGKNVVVEGITIPKKPLDYALHVISLSLVGVENHMVRGWKTEGKYVRYYTAQAIHHLFASVFLFHHLLRWCASWYLRTPVFDRIFDMYNPDLVVTTDSFDPADRAFLLEANRRGVRTLGMIRSWDNATTKGVMLVVPDRMLVTNSVLKEEMNTIHHIASESITIVGIPHYDRAIEPSSMSREALFAKIGLDPSKKMVFYSPGGKILYEHDKEVLALLKKHVDAGDFGEPVQFLVSIPPSDTVDTSVIDNDPNFRVYTFGTNITGRRKDSEMAPGENDLLNNFIYHCDVLITIVSTMAIDGTVFNKPVVVLGFDPAPNLPDKIEKMARYKHFEKFLATGHVTMSRSDEEFVRHMREFLRDRDHNHVHRDAIIERYAYKLGGSADRVVAAIMTALE